MPNIWVVQSLFSWCLGAGFGWIRWRGRKDSRWVLRKWISSLQFGRKERKRGCIEFDYFPVTYSFSTRLNIIFNRSCRFDKMFFVILFWCLVLFTHEMPKNTWTLHPFDLEGISSTWYLRWRLKQSSSGTPWRDMTSSTSQPLLLSETGDRCWVLLTSPL